MKAVMNGNRVVVNLRGGSLKQAKEAAKVVRANWKRGMWGEVVDTLGDDWFWITPDGTEHWDI